MCETMHDCRTQARKHREARRRVVARLQSAQIVGAFGKWVELRLQMVRAKRVMVGENPVFFLRSLCARLHLVY